ncbi:phage tail tape measure protein [Bacillus infantis]|uniref:phage tail tape measure protein n=1 Tax=Bacillus infantis TaxID=324767 RepID=UPI00101DA9FC|nr:phage tail tape measure protein [Bacillus infantis]RYI25086.1 phage tail tape measure protein [Bacillus infantis]
MAQSRIKGITIELDGETKGLDQALRSVNQRSRELHTELSDVNRLLKFDPGNTELLAQRQRLLSEQVVNTANKLDQLREAQSQVQAQFERGDLGEAEYRAFQRELIATEGRLQHFQNQLRETQQGAAETGRTMDEVGESFKNAGEGMKNAGQTMSTAVTLPLVGLGAAAVSAANSFDSAAGRLQAQLGLTAGKSKELEEVARNLWKNAFGENIQEASDAVAVIYHQLGNLPATELEEVAEAAFMLSDAFGVDIQESTRAAGQLMSQFGVDSQAAMDMLTVAFQRGGDYSGELLDTITEYSTQFANMGFSAEQMMGLFISGVESGIFSLDKMGDAVKESFLQITDGAEGTRSSLQELGLDYKQIEADMASGGEKANAAFMAVMTAIAGVTNEADRNRLAVELMGTPLEDLGPQYQAFFAQATGGMEEFEGAAKKAGESLYDNFSSKMTSAFNNIQDALVPFGETLLNIVEKALPVIQNMASAFANLSPTMQNVVMVVGGLMAAIGPLLVVVGALFTGIGSIITGLGGLATAMGISGGAAGLLSAAIATLTGPIGIVIAAVTALIAIFVALYKNNEEFRTKVQEIWGSIKKFFSETMDFIGNKVVKPIMKEVMAFFSETLGKIKSFWDENGKQIKAIAKGFMTYISAEIKEKMGIIKGVFQAIWPIISGVVKVAWDIIKTATSNSMDLILGVIQTALKLLKGDWSGAWETIKGTAESIMNNIVRFFRDIDLYEIGADIVHGLIDGIGSMIGAVTRKVKELASLVPDGLKDFLDINSPSRVTRWIGDMTGKGLELGLKDSLNRISSMSNKMAVAAMPTMELAPSGARTSAASNVSSPTSTGPILIQLEVDGRVLAEASYKDINHMLYSDIRHAARTGGSFRKL